MNTSSIQYRMKRVFTEGFTALDIAEPLFSFDSDKSADHVRMFMLEKDITMIGVSKKGTITGYVQLEDLTDGDCDDHLLPFDVNNVLQETSTYSEIIECLSQSKYCFISILGTVGAIITRNDIQKPSVRMWLFGMISIVEMYVNRIINVKYPNFTWLKEIPTHVLKEADDLKNKQKMQGQSIRLLDCLQFPDKARVIIKDPLTLEDFGFASEHEARMAIKDIDSLRNNLANARDVIPYDWETIVTISKRLDKIMTRI